MPRYVLYGLHVDTTLPLPGLAPAPPRGPCDVRVVLGHVPPALDASAARGSPPWHVSPHFASNGVPALTVRRLPRPASFHLQYGDGTEFAVEDAGRRIWCRWDEDLTLADVATYLLGPVMGFVLRARGLTCLHASAVQVGGGAVLLVGASGAGKSTTAAALARRGVPVLGDDVAALLPGPGGLRVQPAYPHLRLWPDSAEAVFGAADPLPPLTPTWDKRYLDLAARGRFQPLPLPLRAVYLLAAGLPVPSRPRIEPVPPRAALVSLVADTYMASLPDLAARGRDLRLLGGLVATVPLRALLRGDDPARLDELCDVLLADAGALPEPREEDARVRPA
ncbi:MAG: HPr kinase [Gemmatimonadetes bacterium]|nr:HPr kinase [Gemmatimonadota bacterium]